MTKVMILDTGFGSANLCWPAEDVDSHVSPPIWSLIFTCYKGVTFTEAPVSALKIQLTTDEDFQKKVMISDLNLKVCCLIQRVKTWIGSFCRQTQNWHTHTHIIQILCSESVTFKYE